MKTLYEKLSQETVQIIEAQQKELPILTAELIDDLKKYCGCTSLTLSKTLDIYWAIYPNKTFDLTKFYELFSNE